MLETIEKENETIKISKIEGVNMQSLHDFTVMAYNNDVTDGQDVVAVLVNTCKYSKEQASHYVMKIHKLGKAIVFWGNKSACENLVAAFARILVHSEVIKND
jgi:ATP-dependent Clp protease adapter protein ClpS